MMNNINNIVKNNMNKDVPKNNMVFDPSNWNDLPPNQKKQQLNKILRDTGIDIPITSDQWNNTNVQKFINNAKLEDVATLTSFITTLADKTLDRNHPNREFLLYKKNGKLCFWNNENQCIQGFGPLLYRLKTIAINEPQIFNTISDEKQRAHLIETLKKC